MKVHRFRTIRRQEERNRDKFIETYSRGQSDAGTNKLVFAPTEYTHKGCGGAVQQATHYRMRECLACNKLIPFEEVS